jgi:hypothetical protein
MAWFRRLRAALYIRCGRSLYERGLALLRR